MKLNGKDVNKVTYNGQTVKTWIHNGVEIFGDERVIYSAELGFVETIVPNNVVGTPFIDAEWIDAERWSDQFDDDNDDSGVVGCYSGNSDMADLIDYMGWNVFTDKTYSKYKYVQIHYTYGAKITNLSDNANQYGRCWVRDKGYICTVTYQHRTASGNGIITIPTNDIIANPGWYWCTVDSHLYRIGDAIRAGIGITKIVLTNNEPTE